MIRINLLPVKAAQKKEKIKSQLAVVVLAMIVTAGICAAAYVHILGKVDDLQAKIDQKNNEILQLRSVIREVQDFEKRQKDLRAKLDILDQLSAARVGPVRLFDELYLAMPEKLWLTSFREGGGSASISGIGANEETVALFLRNLESSDYYEGVELKVTRQTVQDQIKFQQFDLTTRTTSGKPAGKK